VVEVAQLPPPAVPLPQVDRELAAVAVLHRGEQAPARRVHLELDLGDAREVAAELVAILRDRRADAVEPELLPEIRLLGRPLALARVARVEEAARVGHPREVAARRAAVDVLDDLADALA